MSTQRIRATDLTTPAGMVAFYLPEQVAAMLDEEAKTQHKTIPETIAQWLEDQADGREAAMVMARIANGQEKATPAAVVWARLGV